MQRDGPLTIRTKPHVLFQVGTGLKVFHLMPQKLHEFLASKTSIPVSSLLPGAAGYLGRELCAQLLEDNWRVTALVRKAGERC